MILIAEVLGVILALSGSYLLSKKPQKLFGALPWILFIFADILHAIVYFNNNQDGMVFNQATGILLCSVGLFQYLLSEKKQEWTTQITKLMFYLFVIFIITGIFMFFATMINFSMKKLEWMLALFAISGTTLMASRHEKAKYVYPMWIICDSLFLILCVMNNQYAIAVLRTVFICINCNGLKNWFMPHGVSMQNFIKTLKKDFV